jgi:Ulp1 family protease
MLQREIMSAFKSNITFEEDNPKSKRKTKRVNISSTRFLKNSEQWKAVMEKLSSNVHAWLNDISTETLQETNYLFLPLNHAGHWTLLVCDIKERKWLHFDSLLSRTKVAATRVVHSKFFLLNLLRHLIRFLPHRMLIIMQQASCISLWLEARAIHIPAIDDTIQQKKCIQQGSTLDCGVWVMYFAEMLTKYPVHEWEERVDSEFQLGPDRINIRKQRAKYAAEILLDERSHFKATIESCILQETMSIPFLNTD